jgi:hypothetical protein
MSTTTTEHRPTDVMEAIGSYVLEFPVRAWAFFVTGPYFTQPIDDDHAEIIPDYAMDFERVNARVAELLAEWGLTGEDDLWDCEFQKYLDDEDLPREGTMWLMKDFKSSPPAWVTRGSDDDDEDEL